MTDQYYRLVLTGYGRITDAKLQERTEYRVDSNGIEFALWHDLGPVEFTRNLDGSITVAAEEIQKVITQHDR